MKRLTYRDKSLPRKNDRGEIVEAYSDYDVREIINRLAAYEDLEEQGRLVVLPCKVGDIVYAIVAWIFANTPTVIPTAVRSLTIHDDHISVTYDKRINTIGDCGVWGKTVFASREEAQAELERRYSH